jgi:hypothetical protein
MCRLPAANMDEHLQKMTFIGLCFIVCIFDAVAGQALTPPNFNLAVRRRIEATATCGRDVGTNAGLSEPELFCKLTGANPDKDELIGDFEVIQGQLCDYCDTREPSKTHDAANAVDGTERWWQSPPLSRGLQYNEVNLTISLGQVQLRFTTRMSFTASKSNCVMTELGTGLIYSTWPVT